jgi:predicted MFS family arabinose efflux permease
MDIALCLHTNLASLRKGECREIILGRFHPCDLRYLADDHSVAFGHCERSSGDEKTLCIAGLLLSALGSWIMRNTEGAAGLAVGRSLTGFAASSWVTLLVLFNGMFPPGDAVRATSLLTLVNSIGRTLATSLTGSLNNQGGSSLVFTVAVVAALIGFLAMLFVREKRLPRRSASGKQIFALISRRDVLLPSLLNMLRQYANWGVTFSFIPILANQLGATEVELSALTSMNIAIFIAGNLFAAVAVKKMGSRKMIFGSIYLMGSAIGLAAIVSNLEVIFIA